MTQITETPTPANDQHAKTAATTTAASPGATDTRAWLRERVPGSGAAALAISWYALGGIATLVEPESHHEVPLIGTVLQVAMAAALVVMAVGLIASRRWGLVASLGASLLFVAGAVACPTTGHHTIGLWWFGQMACTLGLVAVSVVALRRARAVPAAR